MQKPLKSTINNYFPGLLLALTLAVVLSAPLSADPVPAAPGLPASAGALGTAPCLSCDQALFQNVKLLYLGDNNFSLTFRLMRVDAEDLRTANISALQGMTPDQIQDELENENSEIFRTAIVPAYAEPVAGERVTLYVHDPTTAQFVGVPGCVDVFTGPSGAGACNFTNTFNGSRRYYLSYPGQPGVLKGRVQEMTITNPTNHGLEIIGLALNDALNKAECLPLFILIGLLIAAMYYAGKNPLGLFDITTPRLPTGRKLRIGRTTLQSPLRIHMQQLDMRNTELDRQLDEMFDDLNRRLGGRQLSTGAQALLREIRKDNKASKANRLWALRQVYATLGTGAAPDAARVRGILNAPGHFQMDGRLLANDNAFRALRGDRTAMRHLEVADKLLETKAAHMAHLHSMRRALGYDNALVNAVGRVPLIGGALAPHLGASVMQGRITRGMAIAAVASTPLGAALAKPGGKGIGGILARHNADDKVIGKLYDPRRMLADRARLLEREISDDISRFILLRATAAQRSGLASKDYSRLLAQLHRILTNPALDEREQAKQLLKLAQNNKLFTQRERDGMQEVHDQLDRRFNWQAPANATDAQRQALEHQQATYALALMQMLDKHHAKPAKPGEFRLKVGGVMKDIQVGDFEWDPDRNVLTRLNDKSDLVAALYSRYLLNNAREGALDEAIRSGNGRKAAEELHQLAWNQGVFLHVNNLLFGRYSMIKSDVFYQEVSAGMIKEKGIIPYVLGMEKYGSFAMEAKRSVMIGQQLSQEMRGTLSVHAPSMYNQRDAKGRLAGYNDFKERNTALYQWLEPVYLAARRDAGERLTLGELKRLSSVTPEMLTWMRKIYTNGITLGDLRSGGPDKKNPMIWVGTAESMLFPLLREKLAGGGEKTLFRISNTHDKVRNAQLMINAEGKWQEFNNQRGEAASGKLQRLTPMNPGEEMFDYLERNGQLRYDLRSQHETMDRKIGNWLEKITLGASGVGPGIETPIAPGQLTNRPTRAREIDRAFAEAYATSEVARNMFEENEARFGQMKDETKREAKVEEKRIRDDRTLTAQQKRDALLVVKQESDWMSRYSDRAGWARTAMEFTIEEQTMMRGAKKGGMSKMYEATARIGYHMGPLSTWYGPGLFGKYGGDTFRRLGGHWLFMPAYYATRGFAYWLRPMQQYMSAAPGVYDAARQPDRYSITHRALESVRSILAPSTDRLHFARVPFMQRDAQGKAHVTGMQLESRSGNELEGWTDLKAWKKQSSLPYISPFLAGSRPEDVTAGTPDPTAKFALRWADLKIPGTQFSPVGWAANKLDTESTFSKAFTGRLGSEAYGGYGGGGGRGKVPELRYFVDQSGKVRYYYGKEENEYVDVLGAPVFINTGAAEKKLWAHAFDRDRQRALSQPYMPWGRDAREWGDFQNTYDYNAYFNPDTGRWDSKGAGGFRRLDRRTLPRYYSWLESSQYANLQNLPEMGQQWRRDSVQDVWRREQNAAAVLAKSMQEDEYSRLKNPFAKKKGGGMDFISRPGSELFSPLVLAARYARSVRELPGEMPAKVERLKARVAHPLTREVICPYCSHLLPASGICPNPQCRDKYNQRRRDQRGVQ